MEQNMEKNIEAIAGINEKEKTLLEDIKQGRKTKYKTVIWKVRGKQIDTKKIMWQYAAFQKQTPVSRTVYWYQKEDEPVRVLLRQREQTFPVYDISHLSIDRQRDKMLSALTAELRREFHIETDPVLRLQGFLFSENELAVILSVYPHVEWSIGLRGMIHSIFNGFETSPVQLAGIDVQEIMKEDDEQAKESIAYWKQLLSPLGKGLELPGVRSRKVEGRYYNARTSLYRELPPELVKELLQYCKRMNVSIETVFLTAWEELLSDPAQTEPSVMAVFHDDTRLRLWPVKTQIKENLDEAVFEMAKQLSVSAGYAECTIPQLEQAFDEQLLNTIGLIHHFIRFENNNQMYYTAAGETQDESCEDIGIRNCITYHIFEDKIALHYVSNTGELEFVLEHLHEQFAESLKAFFEPQRRKFDKTTYIGADDTDREKLFKLQMAQIALYLRDSGLFEGVSAGDMMALAEECRLHILQSGDVVISEGEFLSRVYIVGSGNLEESMTALDGMVRSLRVVGAGELIGVEAILSDRRAKTTLSVIDSQARLISLDKKQLAGILQRVPCAWRALLEKENEQKHKLQSLWSIE